MAGKSKKKRYTEAFKLQVVREYEEGASLSSLRRKYGIGGTMTIKRWMGVQRASACNFENGKRR